MEKGLLAQSFLNTLIQKCLNIEMRLHFQEQLQIPEHRDVTQSWVATFVRYFNCAPDKIPWIYRYRRDCQAC